MIAPVSVPAASFSSVILPRQVRVAGDVERLHRQRRHHRPPVGQLDVDRMVRRRRDQLRLRRPPALRKGVERGGRRHDHEPASGRGGLGGAAKTRHRIGQRAAPIQFTSVAKLSAARVACRCESIRPGMTVRPVRSIVRVRGPASFRMSAERPTAMMRPSRTASASCVEKLASTVSTLPLTRMVSGLLCGSGCRQDEHHHEGNCDVAHENSSSGGLKASGYRQKRRPPATATRRS